jgi:hypothetical protein
MQAAATCAAMIVVIGPNWLAEDGGRRRIDAPADWVRMEIELALAAGKPVIPVLLGERDRLTVSDNLPVSISDLVDRQYVRLHHRSADHNLIHIADLVGPYVGKNGGTPLPKPEDSAFLTTLSPTRRSSDVRLTAAQINGNYYSNSIVYRCDLFANDPRGSIGFNLGLRYRRLEVTIGVLDDAAEPNQVGVFEVLADGAVREEATAKQGQPRRLTVDVTDVLNIQLVAHRPGTTVHPALAGAMMAAGRSNKLPELAWGNPTIFS